MTLRVTLEIVPFGIEEHKRTIGQIDIMNMGQIGQFTHEYEVAELHPKPGLFKMPVVHDRDAGAWVLVAQAIKQLGIRGP